MSKLFDRIRNSHIAVKRVVKTVLFILVIFTIPNYYALIYDFEKPEKFSGDQFYNPYAALGNTWLTCNFHGHTELYGGLTNGDNAAEEMHEKYRGLGYDVPCITNYFSISRDYFDQQYPITGYERGFNLNATHQVVLNDEEVSAFDYPFFQCTSQKQTILDYLKSDSNLVIIAHPSFKNGYDPEEMTVLDNYDLMEVVTVRATSIEHWDAVLSAGRAKWGVASDDSHDTATAHTGVTWTVVNVLEDSKEGVLESLRKGRYVFQRGWMAQFTANVEELTVVDDLYKLKIPNPIDSIILVSDDGREVAFTTETDTIAYQISPENSYVRAELYNSTEWNNYSKVYLNPVIRTNDANTFKRPLHHEVNWAQTILYLISLALAHAFAVWVVIKW